MTRKFEIDRRKLILSSLASSFFTKAGALFARARGYSPYPASALRSEKTDYEIALDVVEGELPQDLYGHAFLLEGMSDDSNIYVKSGKGAVNRLDFKGASVSWKRKLIKTPSVLMAEALEKTKYKFEPMANMLYQSKKLGYMNTSNTNAVPMGDSRLALSFEGGRHWEICPESLELITPIGTMSEWKSAITGIPGYFNRDLLFPSLRTTAHPYYDEDNNEFLSLNYGSKIRLGPVALGRPFTRVCVWDRESELRFWNVVSAKTGENVEIMNTSHSFLVTRNFIGIVDTPANVEAEMFIGLQRTRPSTPYTKVWWIERSALSDDKKEVRAMCQTIKREFIDLVCDYDDTEGVTIYSGSIQSSDQTEFLREGDELLIGGKARKELLGLSSGPNDLSGFIKLETRLDFDEMRVSHKESFFANDENLWGIDFPAYKGNYAFPEKFEHMYWSTVGYNPDQILKRLVDLYKDQKFRNLNIDKLPKTNHGPAVVQLDCKNFNIGSKYVFPTYCAIGALQFLPRVDSKSQDDGYLLSVVSMSSNFDEEKSSGQELWLFDAKSLEKGPICRLASKDLDVAYTLHSSWMSDAKKRDSQLYKIDLLADSEELLEKQNDYINKLFRSMINKYFDRS